MSDKPVEIEEPWLGHEYVAPDEFHGRWGCQVCGYSEDTHIATVEAEPGNTRRREMSDKPVDGRTGERNERQARYMRKLWQGV